jgi:hypothetical protein
LTQAFVTPAKSRGPGPHRVARPGSRFRRGYAALKAKKYDEAIKEVKTALLKRLFFDTWNFKTDRLPLLREASFAGADFFVASRLSLTEKMRAAFGRY